MLFGKVSSSLKLITYLYTNMADGGLARVLSKQGFDPENFVNKLSQGGEDELDEMQKKVQRLADETAVALKRNVYKHYSQFIETAKEISILEGEMYQLSHMLTDQKSIISTMLEMSLTSDQVETPGDMDPELPSEEDTQKSLGFLLEKVEGCSSVLEAPGRFLVHDGDLTELDAESLAPIKEIHAFLMNDVLMLATWLPHRRGPVKYRFHSLYELDNLAVVNARDVGNTKNAFKILMFPDTRTFQADSPKAKRQWLETLEETKKKKTARDNQRKEAVTPDRGSIASPIESYNPFGDDLESPSPTTDRPVSLIVESELLHQSWLQELPEDLDVCIAQRDFEGAVDLVEKANDFLDGCPKIAAVREYRARIEHRIKLLTEVLMNELQISPERSIRGGPRAARRAVTQLIRLGRSAQACELFLRNRSTLTKYNLRQLKIEGNTALYVKKLCEVFFSAMTETGREFTKAFPEHYGCYSAFVVWAKQEIKEFLSTFKSQVFVNKTTFSIVSECVQEARRCCDQLSDIGVELTFALNTLMAEDIEKAILDAGDNQMDALRHRALDDSWKPANYQNTAGIKQFEQSMSDMGINDIGKYTFDDCFTELTQNTIQFTKSYIPFLESLMRIYSPEHHNLITAAFVDILTTQVKQVDKAAKDQKFTKEKPYIVKNAHFLVQSVVPVLKSKFFTRTNVQLTELDSVATLLKRL